MIIVTINDILIIMPHQSTVKNAIISAGIKLTENIEIRKQGKEIGLEETLSNGEKISVQPRPKKTAPKSAPFIMIGCEPELRQKPESENTEWEYDDKELDLPLDCCLVDLGVLSDKKEEIVEELVLMPEDIVLSNIKEEEEREEPDPTSQKKNTTENEMAGIMYTMAMAQAEVIGEIYDICANALNDLKYFIEKQKEILQKTEE